MCSSDLKKVGNIDEVTRYLQKTEKEAVKIDMIRDKKRITVRIKKVMAKDGKYKIGAWLREDTEGIEKVVQACEVMITEDTRTAMNRFNG